MDAPGTMKDSKGASSGMIALGNTNAPVEISCSCGVEGDDGREVRTTFAKCVGTAMFGGLPMTSYVCHTTSVHESNDRKIRHAQPCVSRLDHDGEGIMVQ